MRTRATARSTRTASTSLRVARAVLLGGRPRGLGGAAREPPRRAARAATAAGIYPLLRARAVRRRPRPDRLRRPLRHDEGPARRSTRRSPATTRSRTTPGSSAPTRWRRCASSTSSSAASSARVATRARPYEIVVLSDHGQTQGATFKQRNGYGLDELVQRARSSRPRSPTWAPATRTRRRSGARSTRRPGTGEEAVEEGRQRSGRSSCSAPGNLGLIYLLGDERRRLTLEEIERAASAARPGAARDTRTSAGSDPLRAAGALVLGPRGTRFLATGEVEGEDPLAEFSPTTRPSHLLRSDGFAHAADIFVGSFYDPTLEEGCAFEELISFHGGLGGPQTRRSCSIRPGYRRPPEPIVGAARRSTRILLGWRRDLRAIRRKRRSRSRR